MASLMTRDIRAQLQIMRPAELDYLLAWCRRDMSSFMISDAGNANNAHLPSLAGSVRAEMKRRKLSEGGS